MNNKVIDQQQFEQRRIEQQTVIAARQALDESVAAIDANTLSSLQSIRQQAVSQSESVSVNTHRRWLMPSAGIAAAITAVMLWQVPNDLSQVPIIDEIDSIAISQTEQVWQLDEELLDEMEFYAWLMLEDAQEKSNAG